MAVQRRLGHKQPVDSEWITPAELMKYGAPNPSIRAMTVRKPTSWVDASRYGFLIVLCYGLVQYVRISRGWPLVFDMQVMHYVSFLIDRGFAPYRQIGDMNMPGAYLAEGFALKVFGPLDSGWRLYDFLLGALVIAASAVITRKKDWAAGFAAGAVLTLVHGNEGPSFAGQRDQVMAVLLIIGTAFLFEALRQRRPILMLPFALAGCFAGCIKPTVLLLPIVLVIWSALDLRKRQVRVWQYVAYAVAGAMLDAALVLGFLLEHGSVRAFVFDVVHVLPHYVSLKSPSWMTLLRKTLPPQVFVLTVAAICIALIRRSKQTGEKLAILLGASVGLFSFYAQNKGFRQHQYVLLAFLCIWIFSELFEALCSPTFARYLASAVLAVAVYVFAIRDVNYMRFWPNHDLPTETLERDIDAIGPANLQGQVQCLDLVQGCLAALFHERIVQQTGATGDLLYFLPVEAPAVREAREEYWRRLQKGAPEAFVVFNSRFAAIVNFDKLATWPDFQNLIDTQYELVEQRGFRQREP